MPEFPGSIARRFRLALRRFFLRFHEPSAWQREIGLVVFDFDGVMTDNLVIVSQNGEESVTCHRGDGWGIARLREAGFTMVVLSTEDNPVVAARCRKLKIACRQGVGDKATALRNLAAEKSVPLDAIAYLGNDVNDLGCLEIAGLPVVTDDADPGVIDAARVVLRSRGGGGAVREFCEKLLWSKSLTILKK